MQKPKTYTIAGSNIELLGTDVEKNCKKSASACEEQWKSTGKLGLLIWRIENWHVVPWPEQHYGEFYDGDSYIVLRTYGQAPKFNYDLHFWLGHETSQDEAGTAAYKTVELDTYLDMTAVQHREVQGHESSLFASYFPKGIRILHGGVASAFHHVKPEEYKPRLLHLQGRRDVRVHEVPLSRESLNSSDVFILDTGLILYQWEGKKSSGAERIKAAQLTHALVDERGGRPHVVVLDEGGEGSDGEPFWAALGGRGPIAAEAPVLEAEKAPKVLLRLHEEGGEFTFKEVANGHVTKNLLSSDDVFVFDTGDHVFVWLGQKCQASERQKGMHYAMQYMKQHNRPAFLPLTQIHETAHDEFFAASFDG